MSMRGFVRAIGVLGGLLLFVIGVRFAADPLAAAHTFGLAKELTGFELHQIIAGRDLWLGALAIAFALLKEWRALALWFACASIVCFADAAIAASSSGKTWAIAFHTGCGLASIVLAILCWQLHTKQRDP